METEKIERTVSNSELIKSLEADDPDYAFVEQTEKTETGLDVLIKTNSGKWLAWTYDTETAQRIAGLLNTGF